MMATSPRILQSLHGFFQDVRGAFASGLHDGPIARILQDLCAFALQDGQISYEFAESSWILANCSAFARFDS